MCDRKATGTVVSKASAMPNETLIFCPASCARAPPKMALGVLPLIDCPESNATLRPQTASTINIQIRACCMKEPCINAPKWCRPA